MTRRVKADGGRSVGARSRKPTRRAFLGGAVAGAASLGVAPAAIGGLISSPPGTKLNIAGIGCGGMGHGDIIGVSSENIVALCDVDDHRGAASFERFPKATRYRDFRKLLEKEKSVDAVTIAIPDHMHAPVAMMAVALGKHVYCEKPLTHTVVEARRLAEAAREKGLATQMGNRGQAEEGVRELCEWIWAGAIGKVREVHIWTDRPMRGIHGIYWPQGVDRPRDTPPVPDWIDWNLWLGVAPERPYHPAYMPFVWRGWWDFGTGALGDIGCHFFDPAYRALKLGAPLSVEACSSPVNEETFPLASIVTYQYPARGDMPPLELKWYDGGLRSSRPVELEDGQQLGGYTNGLLFVGDEGKIMTSGAGSPPVLIPVARQKEYQRPPKSLPRSPGHYREWIDAAKGGKPAGSNFDHAGPMTEAVQLGNVALRRSLREKLAVHRLEWDAKNLRITNLPEANRYLHKVYRKEFTL